MSFLALAAVLNIAGANLALLIRIPLYLDTLGTFLAAILFGPFYGMVPGFLSGILTGMTTDIYSLFYLPVQLLTGLTAGLFFYEKSFRNGKYRIPLYAFVVTLPGTIVSSCITAFLFGGITSSGSTVMVQLFHHLGLNLTVSVSDSPACFTRFRIDCFKKRRPYLWIDIVRSPIKISGRLYF